jgi:NifU-like protein involved in Fe-S cluster formation
MATPYSKVYDKFLSKIKDLDLVNLDQEIAEKTMQGYMETSCDNFIGCNKDLEDRDDEISEFNVDLTGYEINVIATGMLYEWVEPYINNIMMLKQYLSSSDFKTYSQANHLKELQQLRDTHEERMERLMLRYSYSFGDWDEMGLG